MQELDGEVEMLESINSLGPLNYQISEIPQSNGNLKSTIFGMHVCMCECAWCTYANVESIWLFLLLLFLLRRHLWLGFSVSKWTKKSTMRYTITINSHSNHIWKCARSYQKQLTTPDFSFLKNATFLLNAQFCLISMNFCFFSPLSISSNRNFMELSCSMFMDSFLNVEKHSGYRSSWKRIPRLCAWH